MTNRSTNWSLLIAILFCLLCSVASSSAEVESPGQILSFFHQQCIDCHEGSAAEAGLDLTTLSTDLGQADVLQRWIRIFDRVKSGEMPPAEYGEIPDLAKESFLTNTKDWITTHQRQNWSEFGRVRGRRLTHVQLERTLHRLLGIDIPLASRMPEEQRSAGFTTVADGQPMSHFQLQEHLKIVDLSLDEAFKRAILGDSTFQRKFDAVGLSRTNPKRRTREPEVIDDLAVTWSSRLIFYGRIPATTAREEGWYRFKIRAQALKSPEDHGAWCTVRSGQCVSSAPLLSWVGSFEATDELQEWTFEAWLPRGHMLEIRPGDDTLKMARFQGGQVGTGEGGPQNVPGVGIESLQMERIYLGDNAARIRDELFGDLSIQVGGRDWRSAQVLSKSPKKVLKRLIVRFAERAFRRPVETSDVASYIAFAQQAIDEGQPLLEALRIGYRAVLCSPRFLYFTETPGRLDQHAIASRLSYFLWNSLPDAELSQLAELGQLAEPEILRRQVRRMLSDQDGRLFVRDFAAQWLELSEIDFTTPDRKLYPGFDAIVQHSMVAETEEFLFEMLENDLSVTRLIKSTDTFLNERLARFYGIEGVVGDEIQKTVLKPEHHRSGLMTHGSLMKVSANGTTTSPVIRGVWVSERLLGVPIPAPPTNVPAIEPDIRGARTIREMLEKHKSDPSCASCHRSIDPPGFALENFDPSGRWRDHYIQVDRQRARKGAIIDASSALPSGESFSGLSEFQELICRDPEQLAANVAEKLMTYGTGAPIAFADRDEVRRIARAAGAHGFGLRSIIEEVVISPIFLSK